MTKQTPMSERRNGRGIFLTRFCTAILSLCFASRLLAGPGAIDTTFNVIVNNSVYCTLVQPNGKILIGGAFTAVNGAARYSFARINPDGSIDTSITNSMSNGGAVYCMLVQTDGKFVLGGNFTVFSTSYHYNVIRLNPDGSIDNSFTNSQPNSPVYAVAEQTDGKILIGGQFSEIGASNHNYIARLNTDGTLDNAFNAGAISGSMVNAIAIQSDGNILVGGSFNNFSTYGLARNNIARLTTNGVPDLTYLPSASSTVQAVYLEPSGKSVWVGAFTSLSNLTRIHVGRLNTDGSVDTGFTANSGINGTDYAVTEDANNEIYQGGQFTAYGNSIHEGVVRTFSDGTLDTNFNTNSFSEPLVRCLAIQPDGKVIAGGQFLTWGTFGRTNLVRLYGNNYPAEITTQPQSTNIIVGTNTTFSVDVSNPGTVSYQWYFNGTAIPGATYNQYSVFNAQLYDSGTYSVFVSTGMGGTSSSNAVLQVGIPPSITQPPTNFTAIAGQSASNSATASGTPLNYYWYFNHLLLGTNSTLVLSNVVPSSAGAYTFMASNFLGAVSNSAVLTVLYPVGISSGPQNESVAVGGTASFSVVATGNPLNYQWLKNGSPITGANASQFQITNVAFTDAAGYSVIVSNQFNSQTSSVATLTVGYPPSITLQPTNMTANLGDTVTFSSAASGTGPLNYQWLFNSNAISGQSNTNLTLTNVQIANIGNYELSVTSPFGTAMSSNAFLNLNGYPSNLYYGLIAYYPFNGNANDASGNGYNGVVAGGATLTPDRFGNPNMAYQFPGTAAIVCSISNIPTGGSPRTVSLWAQSYVTNSAGANCLWWGATSVYEAFGIIDDGATNTWKADMDTIGDELDSGVTVDTNWHQIAAIYDGSLLTILVDGVAKNSAAEALNTVSSQMNIGAGPAAFYFDGALDEVRVYNRALGTNDIQQLYQLESGAPLIVQQPRSLSLVTGQTANFSVQASGVGPLIYQWYCSNSPLGVTGSVVSIPSVQPANAGPYYVVVSNALGSVTSSVVNLTVGTPPQNLKVRVASHLPTIQMQGTPGFNYTVQYATNFIPPVVWQNVATIPADTNGNWTFTDTNLPAGGSRFYRVVAP